MIRCWKCEVVLCLHYIDFHFINHRQVAILSLNYEEICFSIVADDCIGARA